MYYFSQASLQHKYTVTSHLASDNIHTVLSCPAWLGSSSHMTDPVYSLICGRNGVVVPELEFLNHIWGLETE
jgi:hypothetical protein